MIKPFLSHDNRFLGLKWCRFFGFSIWSVVEVVRVQGFEVLKVSGFLGSRVPGLPGFLDFAARNLETSKP
jgi:hypothetical protein